MPKIKEEVFYEITAKAVLREGQLGVTVSASAPYFEGRRRASATLTVDEIDDKLLAPVEKALVALTDKLTLELIDRAKENAAEAAKVARKNQEHLIEEEESA